MSSLCVICSNKPEGVHPSSRNSYPFSKTESLLTQLPFLLIPPFLFSDLYLLLMKSPCNTHPQKQTFWVSEAHQMTAIIFFVIVILLQWNTEVRRLGRLKTWRGNRFRCNIFRLCIWCKKSDHLVLHGHFYLQSWHLVRTGFSCDFLVYFCIWKICRALYFWVIVVLWLVRKYLVEKHVKKMITIHILS